MTGCRRRTGDREAPVPTIQDAILESAVLARNDSWEFFRDAEKKWRWRRISPYGAVVRVSLAGFSKRSACLANARRSGYEATLPRRT